MSLSNYHRLTCNGCPECEYLPEPIERTKPTCVIATGPESDGGDGERDEQPIWFTFPATDAGDEAGPVSEHRSQWSAIETARTLARRLKVEFVNEAGPA